VVSDFEGFFELRTPADLLQKLRHDHARIRADLMDAYAAFDFFVTAEHMLDWVLPDAADKANKQRREQKRQAKAILRVTAHLASGAKHFKAMGPQHKSVDSARARDGAFDSNAFDPAVFDTDRLVVDLMGVDASELGGEISVVDLAERVLIYWESELATP
jgi:hypothetical protein